MLKSIKQQLRSTSLGAWNRHRLRPAFSTLAPEQTPVFFIFTPEIVHLAPFCIPDAGPNFAPILVMNAVSKDDTDWIQSIHPRIPLVSLAASLRGNSDSLLPHGVVLNDLFTVADRNFCIQDPDCFVTDRAFWDHVSLTTDDFAAGAFWEPVAGRDHVMPRTFFLLFNVSVFREVRQRYGVDANVQHKLPPRAQEKTKAFGYQSNEFPQQFKGYFDTLQASWILSMSEGRQFHKLEGREKRIFHIGGTSYLHASDIDLKHWDYWPLSVHYFNLRLLETDTCERFRTRHASLFDAYSNSQTLLEMHPEFAGGWRCHEIDFILNHVAS